ncbi:MAG: sugar O-acetyltransferase [Muribaculaceae bacterium]|nr:sugar O-acetyltransferase [Muribaculaceae bacterium]
MYRYDNSKRQQWIDGFNPAYTIELQRAEKACHRLNSLPPESSAERNDIIRGLLGSIGEHFTIHSPFHCDFGCNITIGSHFVGNFNLTILDEERVSIGDNVFIGPNVGIFTIEHAIIASQRNRGIMRARPVSIADDVWIGGQTVILPGVTIGKGAVIGAGSVVTRDIPPLTVAAGNPCRPIRSITDADIVEES